MSKVPILLLLLAVIVSSQTCCDDNTISVSGNAEVKVKPDIAIITVRAEDTAKTTSEALGNVNKKISQIIAILTRNRIPASDYSTSNFQLNPSYSYTSGERILVGQFASQGLTVKIRSLDADGTLIGTLVQAFSKISGVSVSGVTFDQSDATLGVKSARENAFKAAKAKAEQYAKLSGLRLRGALKIESLGGGSIRPYQADANAFSSTQALKTLVPVRDVTISASVNVIYSLLP